MMSSPSFFALIFAYFFAIASGASWYYAGSNGTANWASMYTECAKDKQSPIDIQVSDALINMDLKPFKFSGYDRKVEDISYKLYNNGHAAAVLLGGPVESIKISRDGLVGEYQAYQFHFHWGSNDSKGSEHTIDSKAAPMELHFIHFNNKYPNISTALNNADGLLVFGIMIEVTDTNSILFNLLDEHMDDIMNPNDEKMIPSFRLDYLFPMATSHYMYYPGSLTTPTCNEVVAWHVFRNPLQISRATLEKFRMLNSKPDDPTPKIVDNFRPVLPLNGRIVQRSFDDSAIGNGDLISSSPITGLISTLLAIIYAMVH